MDIKQPKAILFDWDNTLADSWPVIYESLVKTFGSMGKIPWTMEETKERVHRSLRDSFPEIFDDQWEEAGRLYLEYFESIHLDRLTPINGAEDVLKQLKEMDIYVALVSNKTGYNLRSEVDTLGWGSYFSKVVGAKDASKDKPHPEPVLMALDGSGLTPSPDIWFIGDSVTDLECAHNTDCLPVFYGDQDPSEVRFTHVPPPVYHFNDHRHLIETINHWL